MFPVFSNFDSFSTNTFLCCSLNFFVITGRPFSQAGCILSGVCHSSLERGLVGPQFLKCHSGNKPYKPIKLTPLIAKTHIFKMFLYSSSSPFAKSRPNFELHNLYAINHEIPDVTSAKVGNCAFRFTVVSLSVPSNAIFTDLFFSMVYLLYWKRRFCLRFYFLSVSRFRAFVSPAGCKRICTGRLMCCRSFASFISWISMSILSMTIPVLIVNSRSLFRFERRNLAKGLTLQHTLHFMCLQCNRVLCSKYVRRICCNLRLWIYSIFLDLLFW